MHNFKAKIYKVGINTCVDVPLTLTQKLTATKGYIKVKGKINAYKFKKTLVPVKNGPYRLFVNMEMLKGSESKAGDTARFLIDQDFKKVVKEFPIPSSLSRQLKEKNLTKDFDDLSVSRRKEILKYLSYIKTEVTLQKNISKLIKKLEGKEQNIRIP